MISFADGSNKLSEEMLDGPVALAASGWPLLCRASTLKKM